MHRSVACAVVAMTFAVNAHARPRPESDPGPMERVEFLLGRWQGEGRYLRGPQAPPQVVAMTEHVYPKLGGRVVMIEGHGTVPGEDGGAPIAIHDALGVLSYDQSGGAFQMRAFKGSGFADTTVEVGHRSLTWQLAVPGRGDVRYTVTIDESGRWREVGELQSGPQGWVRLFDMTLIRVGEP